MINKECLKLDLYEYFSYCQTKSIRGLILITDKQYLFYSQIDPNDYLIHNDIAILLENLIHPYYPIYSVDAIRNNHIVISSIGQELFIELPTNGYFSYSEYLFLIKILKDVELYNFKNESKIGLLIMNDQVVYQEDNKPNIDLAISILKRLIKKNIKIEEEKIIGKVLKNEKIIQTMKYHINIDSCLYIDDLYAIIEICDNYYLDSYYSKFIKKILPNYCKIKEMLSNIQNITNENFELENITYDNVLDKLKEIYSKLNKRKIRM